MASPPAARGAHPPPHPPQATQSRSSGGDPHLVGQVVGAYRESGGTRRGGGRHLRHGVRAP
ncbi:hypothetical protein ACIP79_18335 [Streptomyces sp. NPDC088747]|uniref:hypothetical protein n=1 Tax=Streptomyces sp. NPDC088747 TaxID=3365886 RepID=UPI003823CE91